MVLMPPNGFNALVNIRFKHKLLRRNVHLILFSNVFESLKKNLIMEWSRLV